MSASGGYTVPEIFRDEEHYGYEDPDEDNTGGGLWSQLTDGPLLRDAEGNDVFDSANSPLDSRYVFDPISMEQTLGQFGGTGATVGSEIDTVDEGIRTVSQVGPAGQIADAGREAAADVFGGDFEGGTDPGEPQDWMPPWLQFILANQGLVLLLLISGAGLYLARPLLEIGANLTEES